MQTPIELPMRQETNKPTSYDVGFFNKMVGSDLLSHRDSPAVPSALESLTSEFGMGSGVPSPL